MPDLMLISCCSVCWILASATDDRPYQVPRLKALLIHVQCPAPFTPAWCEHEVKQLQLITGIQAAVRIRVKWTGFLAGRASQPAAWPLANEEDHGASGPV